MPLTSIEKTQGGKYLLTFQDHTNALYDIVILAIPCSLYKTIHCKDNVIPKERKHLLDSMQCGYTTKILAPLKDGSHHLKTAIDHNTIAWAQDNILTLYYIEKPDLLPVEPFFASKSKMLKTAFEFTPPHAITHVKDETFCTYNSSITHNWPHDPYAQGSYSYIAPGQEELEYAFVEEEEEKVKAPFASINRSLYFVGEHTSLGPRGTIEAACESGERIARIITKRHYE